MALNSKNVRYTRRAEGSIRRSERLTVIIIVAVFLVLCAIVSVIVGITLGERADKYQSTSKYEFSGESYVSGSKTVKSVDAFAYSLGADAKGYIGRGISDFSICLRDMEGAFTYDSALLFNAGVIQNETGVDLVEEMSYLHGLGGYACAYIYADSFKCEDKYLREVYKAREIALINEAVQCGVDDILILGLEINNESIAEIEKYVSDASIAAGKAPLGVAVSREVILMTEQEIYLAGRLREVCDYIALDLRDFGADVEQIPEESSGDEEDESLEGELDAIIGEMEYYIEAYGMRIIFSKANSSLYDSAKELGVVNIQIVND